MTSVNVPKPFRLVATRPKDFPEVFSMLCRASSVRQVCFLTPLWDEQHPDWRALDARLPFDHPVRLLLHLVNQLDLRPLLDSYSGRGSSAFPPQLLLAFLLLMIQRSCLSPAEWSRTARRDDEAKWLLRGLLPSRSLLYHFRDRVAPFLTTWHRQILHTAIAKGFCQPDQASLDGTFVPSLASRHRLITAATVARRFLLLLLLAWLRDGLTWLADADAAAGAEALALWLASLLLLATLGLLGWLWLAPLPGWVAPSTVGRQQQLQRYAATLERLEASREDYEQKQRQQAKKRRVPAARRPVCLTDPEAALGRDKYGLFRPLFDVLLLTSLEGDWVLHYDVQARATDQGMLPVLLRQARQQVGIEVKEVVVDDGLVNLLDLQECKKDGVVVYAPAPADTEPAAGKMLPKRAFRWQPQEQTYRCPQGHPLQERTRTFATRQRPEGRVRLPVVVYGCAAEHCLACPQQARCTKTPKRGREVKRYQGEEEVEQLRQRMNQPASQQRYQKRGQSVERSNAEAKEQRGLRQFRSYGQKRAEAQAGLVTLVMNGLRLQKRRLGKDGTLPADPLVEVT